MLTDAHIREAISPSLDTLMDSMKEVIEAISKREDVVTESQGENLERFLVVKSK